MPAIITEAQPRGFINSKIGHYRIRPSQGGLTPLTSIEKRINCSDNIAASSNREIHSVTTPEEFQNARPSMDFIHRLLIDKDQAVILKPDQWPLNLIKPFRAAGERYLRDLIGCVSDILFALGIESEENDGKLYWAHGFEASMVVDEPRQIPARTVFLNTADPRGILIPPDHFHWSLSWLVGRIKIGELAIAKGLPVERATERVRDCYAQSYQRRLTFDLLTFLVQDDEFKNGPTSQLFEKYIAAFDGRIKYCYTQMSREETNTLTDLEEFDKKTALVKC
ncbi:MAG: hypothetical protein PHG97_04110 [Candidatus Margulisbacteria bacterium]|nr:hypothetical protein [Candidatus Margulisiibacteriota bacterium]